MSIFEPPKSINEVSSVGSASGWMDSGELNENLFIIISDPVENMSVRGRLISYSISNEADWQNKFEGADGDSKQPFLSAVIQSGNAGKHLGLTEEQQALLSGKTLVTKAQSQQIWTGIQPQSISIEIEFKAFRDAYSEVELPILMLTKMLSPVLADDAIDLIKEAWDKAIVSGKKIDLGEAYNQLGKVPNALNLTMFSKRYNMKYVLENMSVNTDAIKIDRQGNRMHQVVSLQFGSIKGIDKNDINMSMMSNAVDKAMSIF